jgi:hypothetical protein
MPREERLLIDCAQPESVKTDNDNNRVNAMLLTWTYALFFRSGLCMLPYLYNEIVYLSIQPVVNNMGYYSTCDQHCGREDDELCFWLL